MLLLGENRWCSRRRVILNQLEILDVQFADSRLLHTLLIWVLCLHAFLRVSTVCEGFLLLVHLRVAGLCAGGFRFHYSIFEYYLFRLVLREFFLRLIISWEQVKVEWLIILQPAGVESHRLIVSIASFEGLTFVNNCQRISDLLANIDRLFSDQGIQLSERLGHQI